MIYVKISALALSQGLSVHTNLYIHRSRDSESTTRDYLITHLRVLQRKAGAIAESSRAKEDPEGAEVCDKRTENPCCLERRALLGAITHHFNQKRGLLGGVDAKGIASSKIQFNLQIILGDGKKLLFVPD